MIKFSCKTLALFLAWALVVQPACALAQATYELQPIMVQVPSTVAAPQLKSLSEKAPYLAGAVLLPPLSLACACFCTPVAFTLGFFGWLATSYGAFYCWDALLLQNKISSSFYFSDGVIADNPLLSILFGCLALYVGFAAGVLGFLFTYLIYTFRDPLLVKIIASVIPIALAGIGYICMSVAAGFFKIFGKKSGIQKPKSNKRGRLRARAKIESFA